MCVVEVASISTRESQLLWENCELKKEVASMHAAMGGMQQEKVKSNYAMDLFDAVGD